MHLAIYVYVTVIFKGVAEHETSNLNTFLTVQYKSDLV